MLSTAAALDVIPQLLINISRQDRALRRQVSLEGGILFLDKLIKESAPGDGACTLHPTPELGCLPASNDNMIAS